MRKKIIATPWLSSKKSHLKPGMTILHNHLTATTIQAPTRLIASPLEKTMDKKLRAKLIDEEFLIEAGTALPELHESRRELFHDCLGGTAIAALYVTQACQLACPFCFDDVKSRHNGHKKRLEAKELADRIWPFYKASDAKTNKLNATGGESLLSIDWLLELAMTLKKRSARAGRKFELAITTNGVNLTRDVVDKLLKAGLVAIQISIETEHDTKRFTKKGEPTLDKIMANIARLPDGLRLVISTNLPLSLPEEKLKEQREEFIKTLKMFEPLKSKISLWSLQGTFSKMTPNPKRKKARFHRAYGPKESAELARLTGLLIETGYIKQSVFPMVLCEVPVKSMNLAIDYAGDAYVCPSVFQLPEFRIDYKDGVVSGPEVDMMRDEALFEGLCVKGDDVCPYIPICGTGCRTVAIADGHAWGTRACERPFFKALTDLAMDQWARENL